MDELHVGYTDDENYEPFGKLSDGTPVYRYSPPPPPDPKLLEEERQKKKAIVTNYNKSTELDTSNVSEFVSIFEQEDEESAKAQKQKTERLQEQPDNAPDIKSPDGSNILQYFEDSRWKPSSDPVKTDQYLDMFIAESEQQESEELRVQSLRDQHREKIEQYNEDKRKSAAKYEQFVQSLKESELTNLREFEQIVKDREESLKNEYHQLLISQDIEEFYSESAQYKIKTDNINRVVTVTNKTTGDERHFNYIGSLESSEIKDHRLILYSIIKGDKAYGVHKESYNYMTHRHIVYDLKAGKVIDRESYVVSKLDPASISKDDPDPGAGGGAGTYSDYTVDEHGNFEAYSPHTSGGEGGTGQVLITFTQAIINRESFSNPASGS